MPVRIVLVAVIAFARPAAACVPLGDNCSTGPDGGTGHGSTSGSLGPCAACVPLFTTSLAVGLLYDVSWAAVAGVGGASAPLEMPKWWHQTGVVAGTVLLASGSVWAGLERGHRGASLAIGISAGVVGIPALGVGAYGWKAAPAPLVGPSGHAAPGMVVGGRF